MLKNSWLVVFTFKTLTQRFLKNILRYFQFVGKSEYFQSYSQYYTDIEKAVEKKKGTKSESTENAKKNNQFINLLSKLCRRDFFEIFSFCWKIWILVLALISIIFITELIVLHKDITEFNFQAKESIPRVLCTHVSLCAHIFYSPEYRTHAFSYERAFSIFSFKGYAY